MNIILIGMPCAGKSTVGVILAKTLCYDFMDTDLLIQTRHGTSLEQIIRIRGKEAFLDLEAETCASLSAERCVIATGGSVIHRDRAMQHLKELGTVVYLKTDLAELQRRAGDLVKRGVTLEEGQTLEDLYHERASLYEKWADVTTDETGLTLEQTADAVIESLGA